MALPVQNTAFTTYVTLNDYVNPGKIKSNPTIASGDFKISIDGGAFANLTNLPAVTPASSKGVELDLTSSEMNGETILIVGEDQTVPPEWSDFSLTIHTG